MPDAGVSAAKARVKLVPVEAPVVDKPLSVLMSGELVFSVSTLKSDAELMSEPTV